LPRQPESFPSGFNLLGSQDNRSALSRLQYRRYLIQSLNRKPKYLGLPVRLVAPNIIAQVGYVPLDATLRIGKQSSSTVGIDEPILTKDFHKPAAIAADVNAVLGFVGLLKPVTVSVRLRPDPQVHAADITALWMVFMLAGRTFAQVR
jgi:hypothetical protein